MERWQKLSLAAIGLLALTVASFALGYSAGDRGGLDFGGLAGRDEGGRVVEEAYRDILENSADPPERGPLARAAVRGMVGLLRREGDPYALFLGPRSFTSLEELTTGRFSGIGIWLKQARGRLLIVSVLPGTPARRAGLRPGDVISRINGRPATKLSVDDAVARIKGREGTEVALAVHRGGRSFEFFVERTRLELPNLETRVFDGDLGYVRLLSFARGAGEQMRDEVRALVAKGARGIVFDLRDNGGGLFSEAVKVASVFIEDGTIVSFRRKSSPDRVYRATGDAFESVPLVVLVNEGTASASEIVAGALQDTGRAIALVGTKTYGKGSVQQVFPLADSSGLKLTTGAYVTPGGRKISGKGIEPDVEVADTPRRQRERALEILQGIALSARGGSSGG